VAENDPTRELIARGKMKEQPDKVSLLEEVPRFFGVATVDAWQEGWQMPRFSFRKSRAFKGEVGAMAVWLRLCELQTRDIQCEPFDRAGFKAALETIRALTGEAPEVFVPDMIACNAEGR